MITKSCGPIGELFFGVDPKLNPPLPDGYVLCARPQEFVQVLDAKRNCFILSKDTTGFLITPYRIAGWRDWLRSRGKLKLGRKFINTRKMKRLV